MTPAVIIAIDPGKRGGWCITSPAGSRDAGSAATAGERRDAAMQAVLCGAFHNLPVVAVVEKWTAGSAPGRDGSGKRWNAGSMIGTGAQRGRWLEALELAGVTRVVDVYPQTWRTVLAGLPRRTGEQAKASAMLVARGLMKRECGPDEAEAVCIAAWAERSPEVAAMAAKKTRKRKAA